MSTSAIDPNQNREKRAIMSDKMYGTLLCILSDTLFSVVYIFVQFINRGWFLNGETFDPAWRGDWILCFKEWIAAMFAIPIFIYLWRSGKTSIPGIKVIVGLIVAAFFCEYIGIGHHVLTNDLIGMALGLPVIQTITILGCAIFGAFLLREKITRMKFEMICVLIAVVSLFGLSNSMAKKAKAPPQHSLLPKSPWRWMPDPSRNWPQLPHLSRKRIPQTLHLPDPPHLPFLPKRFPESSTGAFTCRWTRGHLVSSACSSRGWGTRSTL